MDILLVGPASSATQRLHGALDSTGDGVQMLTPNGGDELPWNPRSPLSTKSALIEAKALAPATEEVWILGPLNHDDEEQSSDLESRVDFEVKGILYLAAEVGRRFPDATIRFLQLPVSEGSAVDLGCGHAFRGVAEAYMAEGKATAYRSTSDDPDAFFAFVLGIRSDPKKQGKWQVQKARGGLFGGSR